MSGLIASTAIGVGTFAYGEYEKGQANKKAATLKNTRPKETDSPYTAQELALTGSELANGMGADAERFYTEQGDKDLTNSTDAILKGGGTGNNIAQVFAGSQAGRQRLTLMKENLRLNNISNFVNAARHADEQRQEEFQFNQWGPWADEAQAVAQEKQGAEQTISSGFNTATSGITSALNQSSSNKMLKNYFKPTSTGSSGDGSAFTTPDFSSLNNGGYTPDVAGSVGPAPDAPKLNLNFNNSSNTSPWDDSSDEAIDADSDDFQTNQMNKVRLKSGQVKFGQSYQTGL